MAIFYGAYFGKKMHQRKQGITTNQIGKGSKSADALRIERLMGAATLLIVPVEIISIIAFPALSMAFRPGLALQWAGLALSAIGVAFFITAMLTMAGSWRAGIPDQDRTSLVTEGIFRISRNPAFVGFDLMYAGLLLAFPNILHLLSAAFAVTMLHLQILQEEKFCHNAFGAVYDDYKSRVRRYLQIPAAKRAPGR